MHKQRFAIVLLAALVVASAGCGRSQSIEATQLTPEEQSAIQSTPPPAVATPVPIIHAKTVPGAGRQDPFIALYGQSAAASSTPAKASKNVAVSAFPNIPTLPGFEGSVGSNRPPSIWDSVKLTGVVNSGGMASAILEANGRSYIVRTGDLVVGTFRVVAIGPDSVTLATSNERRRITLGG